MASTALVVGAAGGVGLEVAKALDGAGYAVIGTVLSDKEAQTVRQALPKAQVSIVDLSQANTVAPGVEKALGALPGGLQAVVICAAVSPHGPLELASLADLRRTSEINAVAAVAVYQATVARLRAAKGRLVVIGSMSNAIASPFIGHYAASKHALDALGDVMRREAAAFDVKVLIVEPGTIETPLMSDQKAKVAEDRDALSGEDRARYGFLYDGYIAMLDQSAKVAIPAKAVADAVMHALAAPDPDPRVLVGPDCEGAYKLVRSKTDREVDAFVTKMYAQPETSNPFVG